MDVDFSENLEIQSENEKLPSDCHESSSSKVAPIDLAVRLSELYPAVNQRSTPIPTRWADNEDCCKFFLIFFEIFKKFFRDFALILLIDFIQCSF